MSLISPAGSALLISSAIYLLFLNRKKKEHLPPTAPGYLPVIGHLLEIAKPEPLYAMFDRWSKELGPVYTCYFGTQRWIILNDIEAIKDLVVERGSVYSSRKLPDVLVQDLFEGDKGGGFAFLPYGNQWRQLRRVAHGGLVRSKIDSYQPILDDRRITFLSHLYKLSQTDANATKGVDLAHTIEHYTMTTILTIAYGDMCSFEPGDPDLHSAFNITEQAAKAMSPSDQIKEFFPILKTIWPVERKRFADIRHGMEAFYGKLQKEFKEKMEKGQVQDCFVKTIIESGELTDLQLQHFVGLFVGAGSDTTTATLEWTIAFLANHPEIQEKAFMEIKEQIGLDRLPTAQDESKLLYLQCIILEVLRIRAPTPMSIPHATSKDDVYKNWLIPKDTTIIMNLYSVHMDPVRFPNPHSFIPERHLEYVKETQDRHKISQNVEDRPHMSFSTGRRVCVGIHLAERSLFMAASMLISCFKFERVSEELIDVDSPRDIKAPTMLPQHYNVRLVPRHDGIKNFF
ncbi:hypothetical protein A0J61_06581 [Choanephora cucurbitarum]|uniref:Cytochrome P450 n=1 Tax=Choanephora cucurbitarum TaxID=101091 RepID=A0A1C7NDC1_9FUNG|nr:hypothetical protein A0J61_06581 [Choanephora cucurbitarum]